MRDKLQIVYVASFHLTFTNRQLWYGRASVSYTSLKEGSSIYCIVLQQPQCIIHQRTIHQFKRSPQQCCASQWCGGLKPAGRHLPPGNCPVDTDYHDDGEDHDIVAIGVDTDYDDEDHDDVATGVDTHYDDD